MEIKHPRQGDVLPVMLNFEGGYEMPDLWCHRLFQHVLKETKKRGFKRYIAWVSAEEEAETKLLEIAKFHGATFETFNGELIAGVL